MGSLEYDLRHSLKNLDQLLRTSRLRLSRRAALTRRRLLHERSLQHDQSWDPGPWVVVDLHTTRPDGQQGRRSYALIAYFLRAGYRVAIVANPGFVGNIDHRLKRLLLEQPIVAIPGLADFGGAGGVLLTDRRRSKLPGGFQRQIFVKTSGNFDAARGERAFPFTLHPSTLYLDLDSELERQREIPRLWRLFFSGGCSQRSYDTHWIRREFGMVPRSRVLEIIASELSTVTPTSEAEMDDLLTRNVPGFVWVPESAAIIPPLRWLEVVARAAVFAAAPGVSYPMCHNIIEAMAVGTVPLTEYHEQFDPPLRHGENCLVYSGEEGLRSRIRDIAQMTPPTLAALGSAAAAYYDRHIAPEAFIRSLEADPNPNLVLHVKGHERPPSRRKPVKTAG